jgi:hypothetical protein
MGGSGARKGPREVERTGRQLWEKEGRVYRRRVLDIFNEEKQKVNTKNSLKKTVEQTLY